MLILLFTYIISNVSKIDYHLVSFNNPWSSVWVQFYLNPSLITLPSPDFILKSIECFKESISQMSLLEFWRLNVFPLVISQVWRWLEKPGPVQTCECINYDFEPQINGGHSFMNSGISAWVALKVHEYSIHKWFQCGQTLFISGLVVEMVVPVFLFGVACWIVSSWWNKANPLIALSKTLSACAFRF